MILRSQLSASRAVSPCLALLAASAVIGCGASGSDADSLGAVEQAAGAISITGFVVNAQGNPLSGVTMSLTGGATATTTTDFNGAYAITGLANGTYDIQPLLSGCTFAPATSNLKNLKSSTTVNFGGSGSSCGGSIVNVGATSGTAMINGKVTDSSGNPVPGVRINLSGGTLAIRTTTATGTYSFQVNNGIFTLRPSGACSYTPTFISLGRVQGNKSQNFVRNACTCQPTTTCPSGQNCGSAPNGCGGTVACGTCAAPLTCGGGGVPNQCGCTPATTCPAGQNCGTAPDGCGGTIDCGTCAAPLTCGGGGVPNQCGCTPATTCPAGQNCGTAPDGCGGTIQCGTCTAPETCGGGGTPNQCGDPSTPPCDLSTSACLASRDRPTDPPTTRCSQCGIDNGCLDPAQMGGKCEDTLGSASAACASVIGTMSTPTETQVCLSTLKGIFASQCAATFQLAPCLCGNIDVGECLTGMTLPNGPLYSTYVCDFGTTNIGTIQSDFTNQAFGAGQANALVQCLGAFGCDCF